MCYAFIMRKMLLVFAVFGFFFRPEIGALVMSLSTVIVVANALLLKRIKL